MIATKGGRNCYDEGNQKSQKKKKEGDIAAVFCLPLRARKRKLIGKDQISAVSTTVAYLNFSFLGTTARAAL